MNTDLQIYMYISDVNEKTVFGPRILTSFESIISINIFNIDDFPSLKSV